MYLFMYVAGFVSAIIFLFICASGNRKIRKHRKKRNSRKVKIDTYCKAITAIVIGHGLVMITMSYILSWFSRDTVADVSTTLITEVVAPLCLYLGTNCIMNIFEKNNLIFSKPIQMQKVKEAWDKTQGAEETENGPEEGAAG